jgi:hypothetical protein
VFEWFANGILLAFLKVYRKDKTTGEQSIMDRVLMVVFDSQGLTAAAGEME